MLLPEDPIKKPRLFDSVTESMSKNSDNVVVLDGGVDEFRRSNASGQAESFVRSLRGASASRVCASGGAAIPPFFALSSERGEWRLESYVARGVAGETLRRSTVKHDMEILSVIVGMLGGSCLKLPKKLSETILNAPSNNSGSWETWSVDELESGQK